MSVVKGHYISRLQTLLVFLILNGTAKMKLAILAFLYCGEIVKNSTSTVVGIKKLFKQYNSGASDFNNVFKVYPCQSKFNFR